jgi:Acetyltransferase (GNAT) domain/Acetyltransferase (GNAT) family
MGAHAVAMSIRSATLDELRILVGWAAGEGWEPGPHDADAFHAADPAGFLIGWQDGEPIAGISFVRYDPAWAFLGLYIVRPQFRGRGHGMTIWHAAMAMREGRSVGLDGVVARQADYARSGFALIRRNVRYAGVAPMGFASGEVPGKALPDLLPAASVPFEGLARLDRTAFPADRPKFLRAWISLPGHVGLVATDRGGEPNGYGVIRPIRDGWKVGPLVAPDDTTAERLFPALAASAQPGDRLLLDVPEPNTAAVRLAERHGMTPVFETARMVAGPPPDEPIERIFGITSFELG